MAKYLVIFTDQLRDIDINGFKVMTENEVESFEDIATSIKWEFTYPLTNDSLEFSNGDDLLSKLEFKEISNDEYKHLKKLFEESFGVFIDENFLNSIFDTEDKNDEDEDDEDDENNYGNYYY